MARVISFVLEMKSLMEVFMVMSFLYYYYELKMRKQMGS